MLVNPPQLYLPIGHSDSAGDIAEAIRPGDPASMVDHRFNLANNFPHSTHRR